MDEEQKPVPAPSPNLPPPPPPRGPKNAAAFEDDDDNSKRRRAVESIRLPLLPRPTIVAAASTAETTSQPALSVRQRRVLRAVFFFILFSVPFLSTFTFNRLDNLIGDTLAAYSFWSSIVIAGFACGLIVAKLNSRTRFGFIANTLLFGTVYTLLEFFLNLACWNVFG